MQRKVKSGLGFSKSFSWDSARSEETPRMLGKMESPFGFSLAFLEKDAPDAGENQTLCAGGAQAKFETRGSFPTLTKEPLKYISPKNHPN